MSENTVTITSTPTALDSALESLILKALEGAGTVHTFLVEQTPEVIQQVLLW